MTRSKKGFTIVELVIVIAVIAILAAVLIPTFSSVISKSKASAAQSACKNALEIVLADEKPDSDAYGNTAYCFVSGSYYCTYDPSSTDTAKISDAQKGGMQSDYSEFTLSDEAKKDLDKLGVTVKSKSVSAAESAES